MHNASVPLADAALSVTQSLMNGTEFVGVLHALLPWEPLFPSVDSSLKSGRGQSHFFVMNDVGHVLYHPLLPGNFQSVVSIASIEAPEVLTALLNLRYMYIHRHNYVYRYMYTCILF